jgi:hypothetical protein
MASIKMKLLICLIFILISSTVNAAHLHKEKVYQEAWCKGKTEVQLTDGTRVDCVTKNYAIEIDFASKWAECLGQALHYADLTDKQPACLLIIEKDKDWRYYHRLKRTANKHGVTVWYITPRWIMNKRANQ